MGQKQPIESFLKIGCSEQLVFSILLIVMLSSYELGERVRRVMSSR